MKLDHLYDDVFQSILHYLEYEEIARLSKASPDIFVMCDNYVQHDVGTSVVDLYHFTDNGGCLPLQCWSCHSYYNMTSMYTYQDSEDRAEYILPPRHSP